MEKEIIKLVNVYKKVKKYLERKTIGGISNAGIICIIPLIIVGIMYKIDLKFAKEVLILYAVIFCMLTIFLYFSTRKVFVSILSKGKYTTLEQLLNHMTHRSYLYGLVISADIESILVFLFYFSYGVVGGNPVPINVIEKIVLQLFCVMFVIFTLCYFCYHLYINPEQLDIAEIKERIQLYTGLGTTASFILFFVKNEGAKIFVTAILLDYCWLSYFISKKEIRDTKMK